MPENSMEKGDSLQRAAQLLKQKRKDDAGALLDAWMKRKTGVPTDYDRAGSLFFRLGRLAEAETCYREVLAGEPDYLPVYNNLATLYIYRREYEKAIELIRDGLDLVARIRKGKQVEVPEVPTSDADSGESLDLLRQAIGAGRSAPGTGKKSRDSTRAWLSRLPRSHRKADAV